MKQRPDAGEIGFSCQHLNQLGRTPWTWIYMNAPFEWQKEVGVVIRSRWVLLCCFCEAERLKDTSDLSILAGVIKGPFRYSGDLVEDKDSEH